MANLQHHAVGHGITGTENFAGSESSIFVDQQCSGRRHMTPAELSAERTPGSINSTGFTQTTWSQTAPRWLRHL